MAKRTDRTVAERVQRHKEKSEAKGLVRIHPQVPECYRDHVLEYCAKLREEYAKTGKC